MRARVAEKLYPSYLDCIQIEISASNLIKKVWLFLSQNVYRHIFDFFVSHLVYNPKFIENCTKVLDAAKQFPSSGLSIVACIQSVSIAINYQIKATVEAGIHAAKEPKRVQAREGESQEG